MKNKDKIFEKCPNCAFKEIEIVKPFKANYHQGKCKNCNYVGPKGKTWKEAFNLWNKQ